MRAGSAVRVHAAALREWLGRQGSDLDRYRSRPASGGLAAAVAQDRGLLRMLHDAGWSRAGWPEQAGGLGGSATLRAVLYDELAAAGIEVPEAFVILETLGPVLTAYAPDLAVRHLPTYLAGEELWGQGFSEPEAGSDLASLRTWARVDGDSFVLSGQKVWTTLGQFASHAAVLARTGPPDSGHRGLSMLWVDLAAPGVTVAPIAAASGRDEFAEMFFDGVRVPRSGLVGELDGGWAVAMYLLQYERGMYAWLRQAVLHRRLAETAAAAADRAGPVAHAAIGAAYLALTSLRARSRTTVARLAAGENPGPEISVDKILLSRAEQAVYDAVLATRQEALLVGDGPEETALREEWFYSRATSVFGGAVEVQRDIVADRVLRLPRAGANGERDGRG
ncbi:acyl-CoA dehydrogenase [Pseudonocardia sulfidoxydans NBRC 16205]|uniref:Acyl-CoA dehydrogenase n=1 Tax=Pseudonocardia sulfidoxydans NBRC 16205 TaxID=1223511 RepID=A0A511DTJ4_9PSEU|nr:acyl-CoA dehydrogenase [Pseudonocardia sulfidoxydans NBRC 16205]